MNKPLYLEDLPKPQKKPLYLEDLQQEPEKKPTAQDIPQQGSYLKKRISGMSKHLESQAKETPMYLEDLGTEQNEYAERLKAGLYRTAKDLTRIPAVMAGLSTFSMNKAVDIMAPVVQPFLQMRDVPEDVQERRKVGEITKPEAFYTPDQFEVPEWLIDNPIVDRLNEQAEAHRAKSVKYPGESFSTLAAQGRYQEAVDWAVLGVIENAPYFVAQLATYPLGTPAVMGLATMYGASASIDETREADHLSSMEQLEVMFSQGLAEGLPEALGKGTFDYASELVKNIGAKAARKVLNNSFKQAFAITSSTAASLGINTVGEGIEEVITEASNLAIQKQYEMRDQMTYEQVRNQLIDSAAVGSFAGFGISSPTSIASGIVDAQKLKAESGVDVRPTREELIETKARIEFKNNGIQVDNVVIVPETLNSEEVNLLDTIDQALEREDFYDPGEENMEYLTLSMGGLIEQNMELMAKDEEIARKIQMGEELDAHEQAYMNDKAVAINEVRSKSFDSLSEMSDQDYETFSQGLMEAKYDTPEKALKSGMLHKMLLEQGDIESAMGLREKVENEIQGNTGTQLIKDMKKAEAEFESDSGVSKRLTEESGMISSQIEEQFKKIQDAEAKGMMATDPKGYKKIVDDTMLEVNALEELQKEKLGKIKDIGTKKKRDLPKFSRVKKSRGVFYSKLQKTLEDKLPSSAPVSQVKGILQSSGIKQEEIDYSGINEFLEGKTKVSKDELLAYLKDNEIQIKEVRKGGELGNEKEARKRMTAEGEENGDFRVYLDGRHINTIAASDEQDAISRTNLTDSEIGKTSDTKFEKYTLPGGENYREVLMTMPAMSKEGSFEEYLSSYRRVFPEGQATMDEIKEAWKNGVPIPQDKNKGMEASFKKRKQESFQSSHFNEPNILAHFRLNDRQTDKGKTLFIEEIQSDWHQKGRDKGYADEAKKARHKRFLKLDRMLGGKGLLAEEKSEYDALFEEFKNAKDESIYGLEGEGVPDAPFKKTWHELSLKRILRMATEEGYDAIAWTTGEQQADRYDLSKRVEEVYSFYDKESGEYQLDVDSGKAITQVTAIGEKELSDNIGKELAQKIIKDSKINPYQSYSGLDLKVGGEGMKGFYDRIIPQFLNKYTKKWGGRVGTTELELKNTEVVRILEITPSMKEAVMQGQPMFKKSTLGVPQRVSVGTIEKSVDNLFKDMQNAPKIQVVQSVDNLPQELIQDVKTSKAEGDVEGLFDSDTNSVYLVADNLVSDDRAQFVALHETIGHYGLKGVLGDKLSPLMGHIYQTNSEIRSRADELMSEYGYSKEVATEEVLADIAGENKKPDGWKVVVAYIQDILRSLGVQIDFNQADIEKLLANSRKYVREGKPRSSYGQAKVMFSRRAKKTIEEKTGVKKDQPLKKVVTDELKAIKDRLRAEQKGSVYGYNEGRKQARKELLKKMQEEKKDIKRLQKMVADYVKDNLPKEATTSEMKTAMNRVRNATTWNGVVKAFKKIDEISEKRDKRTLARTVQARLKQVARAKNIDLDFQKRVAKFAEAFDLVSRREDTYKRLVGLSQYIDLEAKKGNPVALPKQVYESLKIFEKKSYEELSVAELENIVDEIDFLRQLGKVKLKSRKAIWESRKNNLIARVQNDQNIKRISKYELIDPIKKGAPLTLSDKFKNQVIRARNWSQLIDKVLMTPDVLFDYLDGSVGYTGTLSKAIKATTDSNWGKYIEEYMGVVDELEAKEKQLGLTDHNYLRVGVYGAMQQEGGTEKLRNLGYSDSDLSKYAELNDKEMQFYEFIREKMDSKFEPLAEMMKVVFNEDVNKVENYLPFMTDFEKVKELDAVEQLYGAKEDVKGNILKGKPELGMIKSRKGAGTQMIQLDAKKIYRAHMENVLYAIHMTEDNKMLSEAMRSQEIADKLGERGQLLALEYLDSVARKGGVSRSVNQRVEWLDYIRRNAGASMLGFKLSSALIQPTALIDGAGMIGEYAFIGASAFADQKTRDFVYNNMPELKHRAFDDPAYRELATIKELAELQELGLKPLQVLDKNDCGKRGLWRLS